MYCKNCGNEIDDKAFACPKCGVQVAPVGAQPMQQPPKKKKKKGWIIALVIVLIIIFAFACGGGSDNKNENNSTEKELAPQQAETKADPLSDDIIDVDCGKCHVKYVKHEVVENKSGDKCIAIWYEFTNNSDENKAFIYTIGDKCFQDGVELESSIFHVNDDSKTADVEIKPGKTVTVCRGYVLRDETNEIELEISEWITLKDDPDDKMILSIE